MRSLRRVSFLTLVSFLSFLAACGYTRKTTLPANIRTLHIETLQNKIPTEEIYAYEPGLEMKITQAILRRLHQDGILKVVPSTQADAILEGNLTGFHQEGVRFTGLERVEEYRLFVTVALRLRDQKTGRILWEEPNFSGDASYFVTGPRSVSRTVAADKAIERLARNAVDRIVEDW